uniref:Myosin phosphatase Rho interacting protein n=1 Tax=Tetraodon nigroviridis TaxID=99883 RepID=H3CET4_TETNG
MSAAKENPCRKFQANFFNKSKCQNCFKPRELHLLTDQDLTQGKRCLNSGLPKAPRKTKGHQMINSCNKWQINSVYFLVWFLLPVLTIFQPSTLPQGTVNMNLCTDVVDAEPITGQKNSLCIITPEQEYFIRGENKEIINGWSEQLMVYPRTNKQNQKKKRKVEPATSQEPGPAKVAVTGFGIPEAESVPDSSSIIWQEELSQREADAAAAWPKADLPSGSPLSPAGDRASAAQGSDGSSVNGDEVDRGSLVLHASAPQPSSDLLSPTGSCSSLGGVPRCLSPAPINCVHSRSGVIEKMEALELGKIKHYLFFALCCVNQWSPTRYRAVGHVVPGRRKGQRRDADEDIGFASTLPPLRRAKSLDRRTTESVMTPDLLNFKKGWMVKLDEQGQWKKFWFVLTDHSLRYYKDSIAEEASDLDGEIDLSTCSNVTEYQAQRNYGFQIHTLEGVHTLSAMTAGIRRNWMQAIMKNVRPSTAPDVARSGPDVTQDSPSSETSSVERESVPGVIKSRARERRREGRSKTFDWAEFRPIAQALAQQRAQEAESLHAELGEPERNRRRRREERRRRYETVAGSSAENTAAKVGAKTDYEPDVGFRQTHTCSPTNSERQQRVEEVIEQYWQQVEKTPIREERRVPLPPCGFSLDKSESLQLPLQIEDLKAQLENCHQQLLDSNKHKQELELQLRTALEREQDTRAGYISPATCERRFAAMEESHQKVIDELQRKHQRELENLQEEKERLLAEETAATIAAIEAMKNAHRTEMEKELEKARKANSNSGNADMEEIRKQHEEELCSFQREIEVLSEQYSQKCLENAHLAQALEAERQALRQCQRENQELNAHNQELNNRLAAEITKMRSMAAEDGLGDANTTIQGKELYELEVMLRVKESEVQYLKQEINSLKDELHAAQRDKKYATDKYKDIYTELSIVKAKAERDQGRLRDQLQLAHEALGEPTLEEVERGGYDIMKSKSNPDILKMAAAAAKRSERTMRSKFESRDMPWDS